MTSPTPNPTSVRLEATFGLGRDWTSEARHSATVWETPAYHLLWFDDAASDVELRRLWEARKGRQAYPVVLLAPSDDVNKVRVAGPQDARPVRELPVSRVLDLLETSRSLAAREAASFLAREFSRLEEAVVPGLRVKDLLTPHFMRERLRRPINEQRLSSAVEGIASTSSIAWRSLFQGMGYQVEQLPQHGYLLRHDNAPVAVVHPHRDASQFSRLTDNGELPEGMVLADCGQHGAHWGILVAEGRYRLLQRRPPVGPATGQHVEIDLRELERSDRFYVGLLAPESLKEKGWLTEWVGEAKDFGEELRKGLEERLIKDALPNIARGLGEYLESQGADILDREQLRQIEETALTLVFRFMFLLHTEARGYLPIGSAAYRPHSALQLADDSRPDRGPFGRKPTQRWDRLRTLVRMVRTGDRSAGVPAYNGSLFASDGFPGSALLEQAEIADVYLAPALAAIAYETDKPNAPGLDYAGLQIGHLGAIYYESRLAKLALVEDEKPTIDPEFDEATEGEEVERREKLKTKWAQLEAVVGAEKRLKQVAQDIVNHYEQRMEALEGKAMVVCMSRRICIDLYRELVSLRPHWHSDDDDDGAVKVVMTGSATDPLDWQPHIRNKPRREPLANRFRRHDDPFRIVLVRDMWLTGFDAPSLHTMYVDKPMRGHGLMQAIARVNRVFKDKPGGLVVDYLGLAQDLKLALATYTESGGTGQTAIDQEEAVAVMLEKYEVCCALFHGFDWSKWTTGTATERVGLLPAAQEHVLAQENGKERCVSMVRELSQAFALAVPHEETMRIRDDVGFFQAVQSVLSKNAIGESRTEEDMDHAVRQIISRAVASEGVMDIFAAAGLDKPDISVLSDEFLAEVQGMPHRNLAVELLQKLLRHKDRQASQAHEQQRVNPSVFA